MRLSSLFTVIIVFVVAGFASVFAARAAVVALETLSVEAVQDSLRDHGHEWANVLGDGLQVVIEGEAPSEAMRFRAMTIAGGLVDASRVIDNMSVTQTADIAAPDFSIEILRNDSGVSLIGLIPAATDRDAITADITRMARDVPVTDLLEVADYPVPDGWRPALSYALRALGQLPRSKISVAPGRVTITAISDSASDKTRLETELARGAPAGLVLEIMITAPRPVVTPFTVRFTIDEDGTRFDACAADTEEARLAILSAALAAGAEGRLSCTVALGVPSRTWGEAVPLAMAALAELGGGTLTFADADVTLLAAEGTDSELFDRVAGELSNALPDVYALQAVLPVRAEANNAGPPTFTATLSPEGAVQLRGRVPDELINDTAANFARARFGGDKVTMGTRITEGLPQGWSVRILASLNALSMLSNGSVTVLPDVLSVQGNTGNPDASDEITRLLIEKLGQTAEFRINVTYVEALDPIAGLPTPEECIATIMTVTDGRKITFDPGSATLSASAQPIVDDIAEILRRCADLRLQIAGYTDSQGRDEMNLRLSQQRADAVLEALRMRRVPVGSFVSVGFGEADPIADNATEEGREANRRIAFTLIPTEGGEAEASAPQTDASDMDVTDADATEAETGVDAAVTDAATAENVTATDESAEATDEPANEGETADPAEPAVALREPTGDILAPQQCIAGILTATADRKITFDPGSATLSESALPIVSDIAEILVNCPGAPLLIAGYTDSQGRVSMNLSLSQERADAVLDALRQSGVAVETFTATGFGPADPIADNATEEGREANRRIAFSMIVPEGETAEQADGAPEAETAEGSAAAGNVAAEPEAEDSAQPGVRPEIRPEDVDGSGD